MASGETACSYFVILANNDIVGVKEIWDVLLNHIIT